MRESTLEKWLKKEVEKLGGMLLKFWPAFFTGFPDRIALIPGGYVWLVETKTPEGKLSARQNLVHKQLRRLGFKVWCVHDKEQGNNLLKDMRYEIHTA